MEKLLNKLYYDLDSPALYCGVNVLYREAKKLNSKIKYKDVQDYLSKQYTYTLHRPVRRNFTRNKIIVPGPGYQFQSDLADMTMLKDQNDGVKYLLTCIDVFSRYAWVIPVKSKSGVEIVKAFSKIDKTPQFVQTDEGKEFLNTQFQNYLKTKGIKFFTSKNREIKCAIVERFNRTLKNKIWRHFSTTRTYRYIDDLPRIVQAYNNTYHRSIKMKPSQVTFVNVVKVRETLYGKQQPNLKFRYKIGDKVRVSKVKGRFEKGYLPNWSEEVFYVRKRLAHQVPVYELKDYNEDPVDGLWYEHELQKVKQERYWIEKVIKRRKQKALVKWYGYNEKFNSWVPVKHIKNYG